MYVHVCSDVSCHHYAYAYHPCYKSREFYYFYGSYTSEPEAIELSESGHIRGGTPRTRTLQ